MPESKEQLKKCGRFVGKGNLLEQAALGKFRTI